MSGPGLTYGDRVQETSSTAGTGTLTLAGAVAGFRSFATAFATGQTVYYSASDGTNWEVGQGTYTTSVTTLSRDNVFSSSAGGVTKASFSGTVNVWCDLPAISIADRGLAIAMAMHIVPQ